MTYIKVNDTLYPATIQGKLLDYDWDNRFTKTIILQSTYQEVLDLLPSDTPWSIVDKHEVTTMNEQGEEVIEELATEWDNSEYSLSGIITDYRDGRVSIKMGKPTEMELVLAELEKEVGLNG